MNKIHKMYTLSVDELDKICSIIPQDGILLLKGDLASGKTTFTKALAKFFNIDDEIVSPTFSIMQSYDNRFYHYDIYQCKTQGFVKQGLYENLSKQGLHVIEWGDRELELLLNKMGYEFICISITICEEHKRCYEVYQDV